MRDKIPKRLCRNFPGKPFLVGKCLFINIPYINEFWHEGDWNVVWYVFVLFVTSLSVYNVLYSVSVYNRWRSGFPTQPIHIYPFNRVHDKR